MIGIGGMRLSTAADRDEAGALAVLHAAFDGGITFVDTADAYCWNDGETGHNERLIARALESWSPRAAGDRGAIRVATKGGLTRPGGNWVADGRARHLSAACEASLRALGVSRLHLYQLHAVDPRTPLATSVRALASLKRAGLTERIGLCNVNVQQIESARRIADIDAVQVELSVWQDGAILGGVAEYCIANGIQLVAYRPLGGPQRRRQVAGDAALVEIAARHDATPAEIALVWAAGLSPLVVPIAGPTRVETAASIARAQRVVLTGEDRARLDDRFPAGRLLRPGAATRVAPSANDGEIVLIMGLPGAGKSTAAAAFVADGYVRINRDHQGGSLKGLLPAIARNIAAGATRIVLDNTYVSRKTRAAVVQAGAQHGLGVRCVWLTTSVEDAQVNAVSRLLARYHRLLGPEEMRAAIKQDVSAFGPSVQFRYQRELEPPHPSEGFSRIDTVPFERKANASHTGRALVVWCDGVLAAGRGSPEEDVETFAARGAVLRQYAADGWRLLGLGWQPGIADASTTSEEVDAAYARMQERIGISMDVLYCPHAAGPPICWCRKPLPGLGVVFIHRYSLDPAQCVYVGSGPQDPVFARRLGFQYADAVEFFSRERRGGAADRRPADNPTET